MWHHRAVVRLALLRADADMEHKQREEEEHLKKPEEIVARQTDID